jgi:hypothetical protein
VGYLSVSRQKWHGFEVYFNAIPASIILIFHQKNAPKPTFLQKKTAKNKKTLTHAQKYSIFILDVTNYGK